MAFSFLNFSKTPATEFTKDADLKPISDLIEKLRKKKDTFKSYVSTNKSESDEKTIEEKKFEILEPLLINLYDEIDSFNQHKDKQILVENLKEAIKTTIATHIQILSTPRNAYRENASYVLKTAVYATTFLGSVPTMPAVGTVGTVVSLAPRLDEILQKYFGLDDKTPETMQILNKLITSLFEINIDKLPAKDHQDQAIKSLQAFLDKLKEQVKTKETPHSPQSKQP